MTAISLAGQAETADEPSQESLASEVERLLTAGIGITARAIDQTAGAAELTLPQWRVLVVARRSTGVRIGELAAQLGSSIPSASRLVRRIEARGLVTATRAEDDRRATVVRLAPAGQRLVEAVVRRRRDLIHRALVRQPTGRQDPMTTLRDLADQLEMHT